MHLRRESGRPAAVAPLAAVLSAVLVGTVAFAVDVGWIVLTKSQLQNAADAAVLAGIDPLMDASVRYGLTQDADKKKAILKEALADARALAKEYAGYNAAGGVSNLALLDKDIEFGFTDAAGKYSAAYAGFPNTVQVVMRRDGDANSPLGLFFAPVLGRQSSSLTATATATAMAGFLDNFATLPPRNIGMLPMTYDVEDWKTFVATGKSPDGAVDKSADGAAQLQVYPLASDKGNFGELSLNNSHNGSSEIKGWIRDGLSTADVKTLQDDGLIPLSAHNPNLWDWQGNPGFRSTVVMTVNDRVGGTFVLPLFKAYSAGGSSSNGKGNGGGSSGYAAGTGQGSNYFYNIVQFVGVKIMPGNYNREVVVQPAAYVDPFAGFTDVQPAGTHSTLMTTFTTPRLTR